MRENSIICVDSYVDTDDFVRKDFYLFYSDESLHTYHLDCRMIIQHNFSCAEFLIYARLILEQLQQFHGTLPNSELQGSVQYYEIGSI